MKTPILPANAADYPKTTATRLAMTAIASRYAECYSDKLMQLSSDSKLQKKALHIQKHMAEHCHTFAAMGYNTSLWEEQISRRTAMLRRSGILGEYDTALSALSDDERGAFIQYAQTVWFLHNAFINEHLAHFRAAREAGQEEKTFEDRIVLGTLYAICREWRQWWTENGTLPFDLWTYEDLPFTAGEPEEDYV